MKKPLWIILVIVFCFCRPSPLLSQSEDLSVYHKKYRQAIEMLRKSAMAECQIDEVKELIIVLNSIDSIRLSLDYIKYSIRKAQYPEQTELDSLYNNRHRIIRELLNEKQMGYIKDNLPVFMLIRDDYLKLDTTLTIKNNRSRHLEIYAMDIQPNSRVLEIGGGHGTNSLLMGFIYPDCDIVMNELDTIRVAWLREYVNNIGIENLSVIQGSETSTNYLGKADRILLRNTLHHFSLKETMLNSIKENMNEDAKLLLIEAPKSKKRNCCAKAMKKWEIHKLMKTQGFQREKKEKSGSRLIETYSVK